jgi:hypothetical protein
MAGLLRAADGRWAAAVAWFVVAAAPLWLCDAWVVPWGRDAYVRRLFSAISAWAVGVQWYYDVRARKRSGLTATLDRLIPPPGLEDDHDALMSCLVATDRMSGDPSTPLADRSRRAVEAREEVTVIRDRLLAGPASGRARRYGEALDAALRDQVSAYAEAGAGAEAETAKTVQRLNRMTPPRDAADEHADLVEAFRGYLTAARAFHAASQSQGPDAAADAGEALERAQEDIDARLAVLLRRFGIDAAWSSDDAGPRADAAQR